MGRAVLNMGKSISIAPRFRRNARAVLYHGDCLELLRQKQFFDRVRKRAKRQYEKDAVSSEWLEGVLPKLT